MDDKENEDAGSCVVVEDASSDAETVSQELSPECSVFVSGSQEVCVVSDEMVREEEQLHMKSVAEEVETKRLNEERLQSLAKDGCYERLKFLLSNCVHYTNHLHRRMEDQRQELAKAIEKQRAQKSERDNERKSKLSAARLKVNKEKLALDADPNSSSSNTLQEKNQRTSSRIRSQLAISTDGNNNVDLKRHKRTRNITEPPNKRVRLSEDTGPAVDSCEAKLSNASEPQTVDCVVKNEGGDSELKTERINSDQPILFTGGTLRKYQIEGYKWLQMLYENAINGILADEMGLGKTIQCIALICELIVNGLGGPFLICGPLSTLPNWISEFARFAPKVPSVLYHGSKTDRLGLLRRVNQLHEVDAGHSISVRPVVITSYEIAMNDRLHLSKYPWKLLIVDEGHRIKNSHCRLIKELKMYNSTHRLLLTGTPLQNNMAELWSLLNFLIPEIFDSLGSFETWFDAEFLETVDNAHEQIIQEEQRKQTLSMLHQILQPFVLRRLKSDVELVIPPKRELLVYAPLVTKQQELYRSIVDKTVRRLVEGPSLEEQTLEVELDEKGRPLRQARKNAVNLKFILESENNENDTSTSSIKKNTRKRKRSEIDDDDVEDWANGIISYHNEINNSKNREETKPKAIINVQLRNLMALLRRCCNHPFLIEHPMDGEVPRLDESIVTSCGKMMLLDRMLRELLTTGHKVLIFSQMTMMLNILEDYLSFRGYNYSRLDGAMKMTDRQEQMKRFAENLDVPVFLLSTRAGGLGINLTQADTVIIYDSDWNPQCDLQAQDRCHRIGQVRPVMVYRLVTANTVDQKIVERATAKRKLEKLIMHRGKFKSSKVLGTEILPISSQELLELLKETDYKEIAKEKSDHVISDEDLQQLLDRSELQQLWDCRLAGKTESKSSTSESELKGVFKIVSDIYDEPAVKSLGVVKQEPDA